MTGNVTDSGRKFPKTRRLLKHADFQRVYEQGRRLFTGNMTVFFLRREAPRKGGAGAESGARIGFTVGKTLGGAVSRNRIRRRMREAARHLLSSCGEPLDVVFNPRKSVLILSSTALRDEVARGLRLAAQRARVAEQK
jgi:ribonuclease P protein component